MSDTKRIEKDQYLFRDGEPSTAMYFIKSGSFAITETKNLSEKKIAEIPAGEIIGELALFDGKRRDFSLKALSDAEVIVMTYDSINKQIESLPQWSQALMKTLTDHLQKVIKYVRSHSDQNTNNGPSPYVLTKYISILNLVSLKHKTFPFSTLRNYTIQVFQEPTNRMNALVDALLRIGYLSQEKNPQGEFEITNNKTTELLQFVDWYNAWLFRPENQRLPLLTKEEVQVLEGIIHFASKNSPNAKGFSKVNLTLVQAEAPKALGYDVRVEDVNLLVAKKYLPALLMEDAGVHAIFDVKELSLLAGNCKILNSLAGVMS